MQILTRRYWRKSVESVTSAAMIIAVAGVASRALGFLRDRILAAKFGAGDILDAYYAAFRIPDLLYGFLVLGALSAAFVPVFTELSVRKKRRAAWTLTSDVLSLLVVVMGTASFLAILFSSQVTELLVPGFSPEKKELSAAFTRVMLLSPVLLGASAVFGGVLVSSKRFVIYSVAPVFYNLGIIFGAVFLVNIVGPIGLAWGVVLGAFSHMAVQYADVRLSGFRHRTVSKHIWKNRSVRKIVTLMIPRSLGMAINQIGFLLMTVFASTLASGSLAAFSLANNIQSVPLGLFGVAFSMAVFPSLSALIAKKSFDDFFRLFAKTFRRILFFVLPISVLILVLRAQIVRVILGSGHFDWNDTITTFGVLGILSISLFAQSLIPLLARSFFAMQNTRTPLLIALASEAVHIALMFAFIRPYGVNGLAWAFSLSTVLNMSLLYAVLRKRLRRCKRAWDDRVILLPSIKIAFASLGAGAVAQLTKSAFGFQENELDTFVAIFIQLSVTSLVGVATFIALMWRMGVEEFDSLRLFIMRRLFGSPQYLIEAEEKVDRGGDA